MTTPPFTLEGRGSSAQEIDGPFARIIAYKVAASRSTSHGMSKVEMDSHADSPTAGANSHTIEHTGKKVSVSGFTDELGTALSVGIVHVAVVYDCNVTGNSYLLVL